MLIALQSSRHAASLPLPPSPPLHQCDEMKKHATSQFIFFISPHLKWTSLESHFGALRRQNQPLLLSRCRLRVRPRRRKNQLLPPLLHLNVPLHQTSPPVNAVPSILPPTAMRRRRRGPRTLPLLPIPRPPRQLLQPPPLLISTSQEA
jgi:hypothetical protein